MQRSLRAHPRNVCHLLPHRPCQSQQIWSRTTLARKRGTVPLAAADAAIPESDAEEPALPEVPWGGGKVLQVIVCWILLFWVGVKVVQDWCLQNHRVSILGHALCYVVWDGFNLVMTWTVLHAHLREFDVRKLGLFNLSVKARAWRSVAAHVAASCLAFPCINHVAKLSNSLVPQQTSDVLAANMEQCFLTGDVAACLAYGCVFVLSTPVWEELIFRGFVLTSMTKYMPPVGTVLVSSLVFTLVHFSFERLAYLFLIGCLTGVVFVRTRCLWAPIAVHAIWNLYIYASLAFPA